MSSATRLVRVVVHYPSSSAVCTISPIRLTERAIPGAIPTKRSALKSQCCAPHHQGARVPHYLNSATAPPYRPGGTQEHRLLLGSEAVTDCLDQRSWSAGRVDRRASRHESGGDSPEARWCVGPRPGYRNMITIIYLTAAKLRCPPSPTRHLCTHALQGKPKPSQTYQPT